jgi:hypothetical protein
LQLLQRLADTAGGVFEGHEEDAGFAYEAHLVGVGEPNACADGADCEFLAQTRMMD